MSSVRDESGQSPTTPSPDQKVKLTKKEKLIILLRIGIMLFFELILPLVLYYILREFMSEVLALVVSGFPPFLVVIYGLIRERRVDILGAMLVVCFIVYGSVINNKRCSNSIISRISSYGYYRFGIHHFFAPNQDWSLPNATDVILFC
jgi:hypothetical protein